MGYKHSNILIPKSIADESESIKWLKKITSYMISTILYLRKFFDEESFCILSYETIKLRVLSKKSKNPNVPRIIEYLQGCFQALECKFLKAIIIGIYEMKNGSINKNAEETYKFDYKSNPIQMKSNSDSPEINESFQKQTSEILKNLMDSLHLMKPLPGGPYYLAFKLEYFDKVAPKNYDVRGFTSYTDSIRNKISFSIQDESFHFNDGTVDTGFHSLGVNIEANKLTMNKPQLKDSNTKNVVGNLNEKQLKKEETAKVQRNTGLNKNNKKVHDGTGDKGFLKKRRTKNVIISDDDSE